MLQLAPNVVIAERFRLNRQLGRGGMGSVWHATHLGLDVPCAVKFIEGEYAQLPEAQARFEREAKAAAQLRSPHVVQILDHGVFDGTPYIAMELLDGEELGKRLQRVGRLPPHEVMRIVSQVGRALTKAHSVNIVHRDLKPENIFLVRDDDREIAKVLDFGIAKAAGTGLDGSNTKTGAMLGTPYYMSPEQAQGVKAVDHRSDLWSLGVIVFQALTARLPFESEALGDLLVRIIVAPVPMASHFVSDLPPGFDQWWAKASQRDPSHRFQSAKEFTDGLMLVFGQSQGEYGEPRGFGLSGPNEGGMPAFARTPGGFGATPPPLGMTPQHLGLTPPPAGIPHSLGLSPARHGLAGAVPTTGAPIAHTFAGTPGLPKAKTGTFIAVGGAAVVALVVGAVGVSYAVKAKKDATATAATAGTVATPASALAPPSAAAVADPVPHETLAPPAVGDASSAISPPPSSPAQATATAKPRGPVPAAPPRPPAAPPAQPPAKKPHVDLGI
jgi:serine/threonine-protein kinase